MIEEQTTQTNWLQEEIETLNEHRTDYEDKESLFFEEGKMTTFIINADIPFDKWVDQKNDVVKKIIPVVHNEVSKNLWLNVKNPLYSELIRELYDGKRTFTVFQTGSAKETKYTLVKD